VQCTKTKRGLSQLRTRGTFFDICENFFDEDGFGTPANGKEMISSSHYRLPSREFRVTFRTIDGVVFIATEGVLK
jgi:hypothetical protein